MAEIVIVDYGMANLRSVQKAFEKVGHAAVISADPTRVGAAGKVVLPGVGAFQDAIAQLRASGLAAPICDHVRAGKPFLGICLGLQMLFDVGYEDGTHTGLGLLPGEVVRFPETPGLKVPHMGWNQLTIRKRAPIFADIPDGAAVYFVHSYYAAPRDAATTAATADYPTPFTAAVWHENIQATQFHPEKSQKVGLQMLRNFAAM